MSFRIDHDLEITAPVGVVWSVITDLPRYGEWNPFVPVCRSSLVPGDRIDMRVRVFATWAQPQREEIFESAPEDRLCYGLRGSALASRRCHVVEALGEDRTRYRSTFELTGWLSPVVRALLGRQLERGFSSMSAALKERAETLAAR